MAEYVITADSKPDLDDWGWDDYWGPEHWIEWHKKMKAKYGPDEANQRFIIAYHEASFGAASFDWRTVNSTFKKYAKDNGFYDALYDGLGGLLGKVASVANSVVRTSADASETVIDTAGNVVENAGDALTNTTSILKWVIPAIVILLVIGAAAYFRQTKLAQ